MVILKFRTIYPLRLASRHTSNQKIASTQKHSCDLDLLVGILGIRCINIYSVNNPTYLYECKKLLSEISS